MSSSAYLFVYYKIEFGEHDAMADRVRQFRAAMLASGPGLRCELLQRPEASKGIETWMEAWHHADGIDAEQAAAIATAAIAAGLPQPRHAEFFLPLR